MHAFALQEGVGADLLVCGSVELMKLDDEMPLGSVALAVAKRSIAHVAIVKNFSAI